MAASAPPATMAIGVLAGGALIACGWLLVRSLGVAVPQLGSGQGTRSARTPPRSRAST